MAKKSWKIHTADNTAATELASGLDLPLPIAQVLFQRGMHTTQDAEEFLEPRLADLSNPFLLPDMDKAVSRIWAAIDRQETIVVFGDYDVDGVTSAALMIRVLGVLGARIFGFIPDRLDEGYGLSADAMERCIAEHQPDLIVSVDCGTNSIVSVSEVQEQGVDVVVTDHHQPGEETAPAYALVNPKLGEHGHNLSGVGVAFKLAHGLVKAGRGRDDARASSVDLRDYLDLVALGTVADIVPLTDENRIMVRHGLARMADTGWVGMDALMEVAGLRGEPDAGSLGFQLGPRINAAGRIGEPMQALRLLTTNDPLEAQNIALLLDRNNQERRNMERRMAEEAFTEIDAYFNPQNHFGLVVAREGWHPGVVGIVASRISRHYNRPAIVMGIEEDGSARGSCRGIDAFDLLAGLESCESHLTKFGGHKMAAGLEVRSGELDAFSQAFNDAAGTVLQGVDLNPVQHIDAIVHATELDWKFYDKLKRLRPFGQDNQEPVWAMKRMRVVGAPRVVGQKHLKLQLASEGSTFDAIAFNYPLSSLPAGEIDVAFVLQENKWNGSESLQIQVKDVRPASVD